MAVSAISAFTEEPTLVMNRPRVSLRSTDGSPEVNHHRPLVGSLKSASMSRGAAV